MLCQRRYRQQCTADGGKWFPLEIHYNVMTIVACRAQSMSLTFPEQIGQIA